MSDLSTRPTFHAKNSLFWRKDERVEAARKIPGWREFHRLCGTFRLYFDDIERQSGGGYGAVAFTLDERFRAVKLANGRGKTPVAAVADAHDKSELANDETRAALAVLLDPGKYAVPTAPPDSDMSDFLGGGGPVVEPDTLEDFLG